MSMFKKALIQSSLNFEKTEIQTGLIRIVYFLTKFMLGIPVLVTLMDRQEEHQQNGYLAQYLSKPLEDLIMNKTEIIASILAVIILIEGLSVYTAAFIKNLTIFKLNGISILFFNSLENATIFIMLKILLYEGSGWILCVMSVIILIGNVLRQLLIFTVWVSYSLSSNNKLSHRVNTLIIILGLTQKLIYGIQCYFFIAHSNGQYVTVDEILDIILLLLIVTRGVSYFRKRFYLDDLSDSLQFYTLVCSFFILLMDKVTDFIDQKVNFKIQGSYLIALVLSSFALLSIRIYQQHSQSSIVYQNYKQITNQQQILLFIEAFFKIYKNKQSYDNQLLIISLFKDHTYHCKNILCYCKSLSINNYQQHLDNVYQQEQNNINNKFLQQYLKQAIKHFLTINVSPSTKLIVLNFQLQLFTDFLNVARHIKILQETNINNNFTHDSAFTQLKHKLVHFFNLKHQLKQQLKYQTPILLNEVLVQIQSIIINDINVKSRKWRYLCTSMIKCLEIEQDVVKQITLISNFETLFNQNKTLFKKSIPFNYLALFYYAEVVFLKKQLVPIEKNLKQIKSTINTKFIKNSKDTFKNIFYPQSTVLSFNLSQYQINQNPNFIVKNCDSNVETIFKTDKNKMLNKRLSEIFPKFLWQQNQKIIFQFINNKQKYHYQNSFHNYFIDNEGHVFKALQSMKIVPKNDGVHFLFVIFQKQTDKLILINRNNVIQNVGSVFKKYFGTYFEGIHLESLFYSQQQDLLFHKESDKGYFTVPMIYGSEIGREWKIYLQKIKAYANKKIKAQQRQRKPIFSIKNIKSTKQVQNRLSNYISEQRNKLLQSRISSETSYESNQSIFQNKSKSVLQVTFTHEKQEILNESFSAMQLLQFRRKKPERKRKKTIYDFDQHYNYSPKLQSSQNQLTIKKKNQFPVKPDEIKEQMIQEYEQIDLIENEDDEVESLNFQREEKIKQNQKLKYLHENNSVQSSLKGETLSYFYRNFIEICFNLFKNPQQINDARLKSFTVKSLILSLLLSLLVVATYLLFDLGLYEIRDIFFADGAVSDNMQLSEFMYNRAMNFKQYQGNSTQLKQISLSSFYEKEYLMGLLKYHSQHFQISFTKMTSTKFYQYIVVPVMWFTIEQDAPTIQSGQMLTFYYHLLRQVETKVLNLTQFTTRQGTEQGTGQDKSIQNSLDLMMINFPSLKKINHDNLYLYKQMSDQSLNLIERIIYISGGVHLFLSILWFFIFERQKVFRRKQQMQAYTIYKLIPKKIIEILSKYYYEKSLQFLQKSDLKVYRNQFQVEGIYLPVDRTVFSKPNNSGFITNNFKSPLAIWKALFIILMLNVIFLVLLIKAQELQVPIRKMMNNVNDLMDSQNYLLQTYFDFKAKFIIQESNEIDIKFLDSLLQSQQSSDVIFNRIYVESLELFSNFDDTYKGEFINLLINDTFKLTKTQVSDYQYKKCINFFKSSVLQNGVIMGMNFFTRKVKQTILMLKDKIIKEGSNGTLTVNLQQMKNIFFSPDFKQIDQSIIYMFKMYQATQARIYQSLQKVIRNLLKFSLILIGIEILVLGLLYPIYLFNNYGGEKVELSKIYMSFLLIPTSISKKIKLFASKIQQILQYDRNNS